MKKRIIAAATAALMLCGSLSVPGWEGVGAGLLSVKAAQNVALGKPVTVSALETAGKYTGDMAVDGISDASEAEDVSRWSGGALKGANKADQWLIIDLQAQETEVESIQIDFYKLVWSTNYRIETSDTKAENSWSVVSTQTCAAGSTQNKSDTIQDVKTLKRYVRFYFTELNSSAGGNCISIREITIMGTQSGAAAVESASDALSRISLSVSPDDRELQIPEVEGYDISVYGSEVDRVIGDDGSIAAHHIGDRTFNVILKAVSKTNAVNTATRSCSVTVPDNTSLYPDIYRPVEHPNDRPSVLPTIQEWYGYEGDYKLTKNTKIVVNDVASVDLMGVAKEMQADLREICGMEPEISSGTACDEDDIYLESLREDVYGTGDEGYFMVTDEGVRIYSATRTGALYGTVTAEQILYQDAGHASVPKGVIRDYPLYSVRGIMFDVARIPTRMQFLHDYTKILKWYKINEMQLHLNDNQWSEPAYSPSYDLWKEVEGSHRLWSDTFPSLAVQRSKFMRTGDNEGRYDYYYSTHTGKTYNGEGCELYYTKDEYRSLQDDATARGVNLVAELDTPSHSAAYTKYVHDNQEEVIKSLVEKGYLNREDYLDASGNVKAGASFYINSTANFELLALEDDSTTDAQMKQNAINAKIFMKALFDEYLGGDDPLFATDTVNAGVDEYWDKGTTAKKEAFRRYMNYMYDLLGETANGYGKEVRMWGSLAQFPGTTDVNKNIVLEIWNARGEDQPLERIKEGFRVVNIPQQFLYTTPGRYHKDMVNEEYIYETWDPLTFDGGQKATAGEPALLGAKAALWGDENREGITEADLNERYLRVAALLGEKTWGGTKKDDTFIEYEQTFDRLREGPGTQIANQIESKTNVVLDYDFKNLSKNGQTVYDASGNGYDGTVKGGQIVDKDGEKMLRFDGNTTIETPLTSLGYPYTMSFDVYLDGTEANTKESSLFSGYDGRLQIAGIDGNLSLNRDYFSQSFGYKAESGTKHRITIVGTYQVTKLYVDGVFQKILYAAASDPDSGGAIAASTWTDADNNFRTTFVFPLNVIGKGFSGCLGNIKAYNKALSVEELGANVTALTEADVARNRHAYADKTNSGYKGDEMRLYPAWKATDGDGHVTGVTETSTSNESRWCSSDNDSDFLVVDLGMTRKISKVVIDWYKSGYAAAYDIQVSDDGNTWRTVKSVTGNSSALTTDTFAETEARYVKMQGVTRAAADYVVYEMKVYGSVDRTALADAVSRMEKETAERKIGFDANGNSKNVFDALLYAKAVYGDVMAGQEEIDAAVASIETALESMPTQEQQKEMAGELARADGLSVNKDSYDKESWDAYMKAYDAAKKAEGSASAEEYARLLEALKDAYSHLKPKTGASSHSVTLASPAVKSVKSQTTRVQVTWSAVPNASSYQLYRKVGSRTVKVGAPVKGTTAYDSAPVANKNMSYCVAALAGGREGYRDSAAGAAMSIKLPQTTKKVTATQVKGKKAVTLRFKKVKNASSYLIFRSEKKNGSWKKVGTVKKNKATTFRDKKKLKKGRTYYYCVVTAAQKKYSPMKAAKKAVKIK